ncbi:MAG: methyltransferase domain-containing protein [Candidatus Omnitrophica bacterium]|nr:methyltransferase domain-containing protein [Candidatus Omnitrophota bacterium]
MNDARSDTRTYALGKKNLWRPAGTAFLVLSAFLLVFFSALSRNELLASEDLEYEHWSEWIIPERDSVWYPEEVIRLMGISPGDRIADIGAGPGYLLFRIAEQVGPDGMCYAIDTGYRGELLSYMLEKVKDPAENPYNNIRLLRNNGHDVLLPPGSIDSACMCLTGIGLTETPYFEKEGASATVHERLIRSVHRALRPGGRLVVIDLIASAEEIKEHSVNGRPLVHAATDLEAVKRIFRKAGFRFEGSHGIFRSNEHFENVRDFRKSEAFRELGKARNFLGREMFFFIFRKEENTYPKKQNRSAIIS